MNPGPWMKTGNALTLYAFGALAISLMCGDTTFFHRLKDAPASELLVDGYCITLLIIGEICRTVGRSLEKEGA